MAGFFAEFALNVLIRGRATAASTIRWRGGRARAHRTTSRSQTTDIALDCGPIWIRVSSGQTPDAFQQVVRSWTPR